MSICNEEFERKKDEVKYWLSVCMDKLSWGQVAQIVDMVEEVEFIWENPAIEEDLICAIDKLDEIIYDLKNLYAK